MTVNLSEPNSTAPRAVVLQAMKVTRDGGFIFTEIVCENSLLSSRGRVCAARRDNAGQIQWWEDINISTKHNERGERGDGHGNLNCDVSLNHRVHYRNEFRTVFHRIPSFSFVSTILWMDCSYFIERS
ncbi:MAG: hypothetical protein FVQ79_14310 [Planctomycetes bacterium]|nr:hypothetical protein [Planctomycetota bacterium]